MCLCGMYNKPVKTKKYIFYPQGAPRKPRGALFHNWQYLSMRVAAKTAYTSLRIILVYECNAKVFKCVFTPMQHSQARCSS